MSDGSGGIRAVMISTLHYSKVMEIRDHLGATTVAKTLELLIDAASKEVADERAALSKSAAETK